ncbi:MULTISPECIES: acyl-CoA thioesterase [unclassified Alistipes]|jgi:acyl-CoA thioester hydrolase|uniref:acyl-CoA thioesterase n=1 Tax=unclassified Alistipes TaxID=2608932 RepID=UPI000D1064D6|nr:acyl-CoA thioesterase [Alistipes sp. Marseille-P5061]HIV32808.1 acyl-CoA thioesterase [Candidatus Alistipes excrementigallinarum]
MKRKRETAPAGAALSHTTTLRVRFSEVDSMSVVWHGEYVRYFEDGREAFGERYPGLGYLDIYASGYTAPIVALQVDYRRPLRIAERAEVETRYIPTEAAKICFEYTIRRASDGEVVATGSTTQVFVNTEGELELTAPQFFKEWKRRWNIE